MKTQLIEFGPIVLFLFFLISKDIYWATAALMFGSLLQTLLHYYFFKSWKKTHLFGLALAVLLGAMTLVLHDPDFIKWKFTILYWGLAIALLWRFLAKKIAPIKELLELATKTIIPAPNDVWNKLTYIWFFSLALMGAFNLVLAYQIFPDNDKAWGIAKIIMSFVGTFGLMIYTFVKVHKYIPESVNTSTNE